MADGRPSGGVANGAPTAADEDEGEGNSWACRRRERGEGLNRANSKMDWAGDTKILV